MDDKELQFKREDLARSNAIARDEIKSYSSSIELWSCAFAFGLAVTGTVWNFVIPANSVPFIVATLGASENTSLFSIIWNLSVAIGLVIYGRLGDQFGRKPFVIGGLILGVVGAAVSSQAPNIDTLVGAQVLCGLGAVPCVAYPLFAEMAPARYKFLWLMPTFVMSIPLTGAGALIAGSLCRLRPDGWRLVYYCSIAMQGAAAIILFLCYHPPTFRQIHGSNRTYMEEIKRLDFVGLALIVIGGTTFILGISWGGQPSPWDSAKILSLLIVGAVFLVAFVAWELFANPKLPLIPMRLFREIKGFPSLLVLGCVHRVIYTSSNIIWPGEVAAIFYRNELAHGEWKQAGWTTSMIGFGLIAGLVIWAPLMDIIRHTRATVIIFSIWVVAFWGGFFAFDPTTLTIGKALAFLALFPVGILQDYVLLFAQFVCREQELGVVVSLMFFFQLFFGSVFTSVFLAILNNKLPNQIVSKVNAAALANGFPESNLAALDTAALGGGDLSAVPGMTDSILTAVNNAIPYAYAKSYQYVTAAGFALTIVGFIAACFMPSYDSYFTNHVSRPNYRHAKEAEADLLEDEDASNPPKEVKETIQEIESA